MRKLGTHSTHSYCMSGPAEQVSNVWFPAVPLTSPLDPACEEHEPFVLAAAVSQHYPPALAHLPSIVYQLSLYGCATFNVR